MLTTPEAAVVGAVIASLQGSNLPIREPSWTAPSFWSRPLFKTVFLPVPANSGWVSALTVSGQPGYIAMVSHFTATSVGDILVSGLQFRIRLDGSPLPASAVNIAPGVEISKAGPNEYPLVPRKLFQPVLQGQTLTIEVNNPTGLQRVALASFNGWFFDTVDASTLTMAESLNPDATYRGQTGAAHE